MTLKNQSQLINFENKSPILSTSSFIAPGAVLAGDVTIGPGSNIWFNCVLRGDVAPIIVGKNTNIQDGSVVHTSRYQGKTEIGNNVTIGHMALIHACTICDEAFIGMGAIIMDKVVVENRAFIAAGSLVTPGKMVKTDELWAGRPACFVRKVTKEELKFMQENISSYLALADKYRQEKISPIAK